jgi:hypothetical protein
MISTTDFDIFLKNQSEYLTVFVRDPRDEELTDVVGTSTFNLINISDDSSEDSGTFTATGGTSIVRASTGVYQYLFDGATYPDKYIASFRCVLDSDVMGYNTFVKTVGSKYYAYAAQLRPIIDKAQKSVSDLLANMDRTTNDPAVQFNFGVDLKAMCLYLDRGIQYINIVPPYTNFNVENFYFDQNGSMLLDAALIAYLEAQQLFAIDTDYNYSLGGNSFVVDHFTKLNSFLSALFTRFDKSLISWKQQFRSKGTVLFCWQPGGVRSARQLNALPGGYWSRLLSAAFV